MKEYFFYIISLGAVVLVEPSYCVVGFAVLLSLDFIQSNIMYPFLVRGVHTKYGTFLLLLLLWRGCASVRWKTLATDGMVLLCVQYARPVSVVL